MAMVRLACAIVVLFCIEVRSHNANRITSEVLKDNLLYKNKFVPNDWKRDPRYTFKWEGDFTYGVPRDSKCDKVIIPHRGRFVCSSGKGINSRIMCLTECQDGYEHLEKSTVFICKNDEGTWRNIYRKIVKTPHPTCVKSKWSR